MDDFIPLWIFEVQSVQKCDKMQACKSCCDIGTRYFVNRRSSAKATNVCHIMRCHRLTNSGAPTFFLLKIQKVEQHSNIFKPFRTREKLHSSFGFLSVPHAFCVRPIAWTQRNTEQQRTQQRMNGEKNIKDETRVWYMRQIWSVSHKNVLDCHVGSSYRLVCWSLLPHRECEHDMKMRALRTWNFKSSKHLDSAKSRCGSWIHEFFFVSLLCLFCVWVPRSWSWWATARPQATLLWQAWQKLSEPQCRKTVKNSTNREVEKSILTELSAEAEIGASGGLKEAWSLKQTTIQHQPEQNCDSVRR